MTPGDLVSVSYDHARTGSRSYIVRDRVWVYIDPNAIAFGANKNGTWIANGSLAVVVSTGPIAHGLIAVLCLGRFCYSDPMRLTRCE